MNDLKAKIVTDVFRYFMTTYIYADFSQIHAILTCCLPGGLYLNLLKTF